MTTYTLSTLGKLPISNVSAVGDDVRNDPGFDAIETEMAKLGNPSTSTTMDWQLVCNTSAELLSDKGKDILVACYMSCGLLQTSGLTGLSQGMTVVADMLETYWETLYPPLTRLRARRNALQFLIDHIQSNASESAWATDPQDPTLIQTLLANANRINNFMQDKDVDAPSMQPVIGIFNSIPVIDETVVSEPTKEQKTTADQKADSLIATSITLDEVNQTLEKINKLLGTISATLFDANMVDPLGYRLARIAVWSTIEKAPSASENQTLIPPPNSQLLDALHGLQANQDNQNLIRFAETQLPQHPFWLDLNRVCADALGQIGASQAQREVISATHYLSQRLPELSALSFSDGMPFADLETRSWLQENSASDGADRHENKLQNAIHTANTLASNNLGEAADFLQNQLNQTTSARDKLVLRIHLCELMLAQRPASNLHPFAMMVVKEIDRFQLAEWDPLLAIKGLKAAYSIMVRNEGNKQEADKLLARIIELDAGSGVRSVL